MIKMSRFTHPLLLAASLGLPCAAWAETAPDAPPPASEEAIAPEAPPAEEPKVPLFSLQYTLGDAPAKILEVFEDNPVEPFLEILKQSADLASKAQNKPAQVQTSVEWQVPEDVAETFGKLPMLLIDTTVQQDGSGRSLLNIPAYRQQVKQEGSEGNIDWKGLSGEVSYANPKLESPVAHFNVPGLHVQIDKEVDFSLRNLTLGGELDANWLPSKLEFKLPEFDLKAEEGQMALRNAAMNFVVQEARPGLTLGEGAMQIERFTFQEGESQAELQGMKFSGGGKLAGDLITWAMNMDVDKLSIPEELAPGSPTDFAYHSALEVRNIDAGAVADVQKTLRELQQQAKEGIISEEMIGIAMMGKSMEMLPKLWAKSPELALTRLQLKTAKGEVNGSFTLRIDGKQKLDMEKPENLQAALSGSAELIVAKALLQEMFTMQLREAMAQGGGMATSPDAGPADAAAGEEGEAEEDEGAQAESGDQAEAETEQGGAPDAPAMSEEQIAQMVEAQIQGLVEEKWLVQADPNTYKLNAILQAGKLTVNGKEVPLEF